MKVPKPTNRLELRKDISVPNRYFRAGHTATAETWELMFPKSTTELGWRDWFINLDEPLEESPRDPIRELVKEVFAERGLRSQSYIGAAIEAINRYKKQSNARTN